MGQGSSPPPRAWDRPAVRLGVLVLLALIAYGPALTSGYIWDDDDYLTENTLVRDLDGLKRIWTTADAPQYYPLYFTSFWIEYQLWGDHPAGYHLVNVLLHALSAFLVWRILLALGFRAAWWVALLFALHPVHVESVAWVTERKNTLSGAFYLAAALAYLRWDTSRRAAHYAAAVGLFVAALLSKTATATLPVALFFLVSCRHGRPMWSQWKPLAPLVGVAAAIAAITVRIESGMVDVVTGDFTLGWADRIVVACRALLFYPYKLLAPYPLSFNYRRWDLDAGTIERLWPILAILLVAAVGVRLLQRGFGPRRDTESRTAATALLYYAVTIGPALGFIDVYYFRYAFVADHWQYLASLGLLALFVQLARLGAERMRLAPTQGRAAAVVIVALLAVMTWQQSTAYENEETLWRRTIAVNPDSWIAHNNLASLLVETDAAEALAEYDEAIRCKETAAESWAGRGAALLRLERFAEADAALDRAVELDPTYPQTYLNRAQAALQSNRPADAVADLDRFIDSNPDFAVAYRLRSEAYTQLRRLPEALRDMDEVIRRGGTAQDHGARGSLHMLAGRFDVALTDFDRALQLNPQGHEIRSNRALAYLRLNRLDDAGRDIDAVISATPQASGPWVIRGMIAQARSGNPTAGCTDWQQACERGDCRAFQRACRRPGS